MDHIDILVFRPTVQTVRLHCLPDHDRIIAFEADQRGTESAYHVEVTFQYRGGPQYGVNIPVSIDPFDLRFIVFRPFGDEDWPYCDETEPLYVDGELTLADIARDLRDFVENNFHWRED